MPRTELDLRGLSLSELMEQDANIGNALDDTSDPIYTDSLVKQLLADRRQIRKEMEQRIADAAVAREAQIVHDRLTQQSWADQTRKVMWSN